MAHDTLNTDTKHKEQLNVFVWLTYTFNPPVIFTVFLSAVWQYLLNRYHTLLKTNVSQIFFHERFALIRVAAVDEAESREAQPDVCYDSLIIVQVASHADHS